jgi:hypothetical protein
MLKINATIHSSHSKMKIQRVTSTLKLPSRRAHMKFKGKKWQMLISLGAKPPALKRKKREKQPHSSWLKKTVQTLKVQAHIQVTGLIQ